MTKLSKGFLVFNVAEGSFDGSSISLAIYLI